MKTGEIINIRGLYPASFMGTFEIDAEVPLNSYEKNRFVVVATNITTGAKLQYNIDKWQQSCSDSVKGQHHTIYEVTDVRITHEDRHERYDEMALEIW